MDEYRKAQRNKNLPHIAFLIYSLLQLHTK